MIVSSLWRDRRYVVLGLARSGLATVQSLLAAGARVTAWDANEARRDALRSAPGVSGDLTFADPLTLDLAGFAGVVMSPGVPLNRHPLAAHARAAAVPLLGDIELFAEARAGLPPHRVVGITGTNGKSTTTALIHHILTVAGMAARLGGNIGLPILGQQPLPAGGVYVLELSSYQIDLTHSLDCDVAILLNLTPDHLDRYDGFEGYVASKARLFAMQAPGHSAIVGIGDVPSSRVAQEVERSGQHSPVVRIAPGGCLDQSRWPALQGPHNALNALAAMQACAALGVSGDAIEQGLASFAGLPHRMQCVATRNGVRYIDDSKATNAEAAAPALAAFASIHWILGGQAKTDHLDPCCRSFDRVKCAYLIGEAAPLFARLLAGKVPVLSSGTLVAAVQAAAAAAVPGDTVLLSPACASFDQFRDFEDRGNQFRAAVEALP